jgi:hypothetical protein
MPLNFLVYVGSVLNRSFDQLRGKINHGWFHLLPCIFSPDFCPTGQGLIKVELRTSLHFEQGLKGEVPSCAPSLFHEAIDAT